MNFFDPLEYPYLSHRQVVFSNQGMVATSQPLAAQAGLEVMQKGGNAIDAAVATAVTLTVTEPTSNGIGGDAFAIIKTQNGLYGLNSSGPAPKGINADKVKEKGYQEMPNEGWLPVTVPGAPAAWRVLSETWGKLPMQELFAPGIRYAHEGFPLSPKTAENWRNQLEKYNYLASSYPEDFAYFLETFAPHGRAPRAGELWKAPDHANTLQIMADTGGEAFYKGELAEKIDSFSRKRGGFLKGEDLEKYLPQWVDPLKVNYRGWEVWELPPNGQGLVTLMALRLLEEYPLCRYPSQKRMHLAIEALKLAYYDGYKHITDPAWMDTSPSEMLREKWIEARRTQIKLNQALKVFSGKKQGGTVYLATADGEGNMVSFIQSNYRGFGSGLVVPGTGIALQNRGMEFSLHPQEANYLEPGKRSFHTIMPGFLSKKGEVAAPFGLMGGYMQPQGHLQLLINLIDLGFNPQASLDAPRWKWREGAFLELEKSLEDNYYRDLNALGHQVEVSRDNALFGKGQIIWRNEKTGTMCGGTEPRADGAVCAW